MRLEYFPDTDTLYIGLKETPGADTREVGPGVVLDVDAAGEVVGIEVEHASERADLTTLKLDSVFGVAVGNAKV